jgi:hypothetical protein
MLAVLLVESEARGGHGVVEEHPHHGAQLSQRGWRDQRRSEPQREGLQVQGTEMVEGGLSGGKLIVGGWYECRE